MCGIVFYKSFNHSKVNKKVLKQYKAQRARGSEGFGFYLPETNRLAHSPKESRIKSLLGRYGAEEVLFHHRFPTSTDNVRNACHPFSTKDFFGNVQYVMVHNGWLHNPDELKRAHQKLGITYVSKQPITGKFNDSEALMYDLALTFEEQQKEPAAIGAASFIMIERRDGEPFALHFGRNTNPLNMVLNDEGLSLSSEGEGEPIKANVHYTYLYATGELTEVPFTIKESRYTNAKWNPGYSRRDYSGGQYESQRWGGLGYNYATYDDEDYPGDPARPKKVAIDTRHHDDILSSAGDLLMESAFEYADALEQVDLLIKKYARMLVRTKAAREGMTDALERSENDREIAEYHKELMFWTEVQMQVIEWRESEREYQTNNQLLLTPAKEEAAHA